MSNHLGVSAFQMANRIVEREDNIYKKEVVYGVLKAYMQECRKALINGERVQLAEIGTIIPEVKTCKNHNLPVCNKEEGNPPYTRLRLYRNQKLMRDMNSKLVSNIDNGILGLENLPFDIQQINILKKSGYISDDVKDEYEED